MLFISGNCIRYHRRVKSDKFQSRNRDAFHFRSRRTREVNPLSLPFQSRNRDAFHFRLSTSVTTGDAYACFNLAIEMLFISGSTRRLLRADSRLEFQSRNRDAFHFRCRFQARRKWVSILSTFQSRNRDAFHFRRAEHPSGLSEFYGFNLAIEMLFISGFRCRWMTKSGVSMFQSRNRDAFHFRARGIPRGGYTFGVSISQSRGFSFQVGIRRWQPRDIFEVSISQSRCFSFQGRFGIQHARRLTIRFNLAIEMLFISGRSFVDIASDAGVFQSRNRDAFHFR